MYLKTENLTLVLIFDRLEHFRCFCRYGGNGALGDDRDDDPSVHDRRDLRRAAGGRAGWVLRHPQPRCVPGRPERRAVYLVVHPVHGRSHRRHFRGHGGRCCNHTRTTFH